MASTAIRLRRALPLSSTLRGCSVASTTGAPSLLRTPVTAPPSSQMTAASTAVAFLSCSPLSQIHLRGLHSTSLSLSSSRSNFDDRKFDENEPLFEGCDYKHWLITMDFPEPKPSPEEMVETYVQTLAKVVGSVEEAKKRMYACSTTTYNGFQAEIDEETANKFEGMPGVVFVLPDSYIDPVNKEYGGDKYINGTIIPRPPPVQYGRPRQRRDRPGMQGDGRSSMQQNYASQQNNGPPQSNYGPPGNIPPRSTYAPPGNYPPQSNYGPPGNVPPRSTYAPSGNYPPQSNYGPPGNIPPRSTYAPSGNYPPQSNYGPPGNIPPAPQSNYNPPQPNYPPLGTPNHASSGNPNLASLGTPNHVPLRTPNHVPSGNPTHAPSQQYSAPPVQGERRNYMPTYQGDYPVGGDNYQGGRNTYVPHHQGYNNQGYQPPQGQRGSPPGQQNWSGQASFAGEKNAPLPPSQGPYGHGGFESYGQGNIRSYGPGDTPRQGAGPGYTAYGANKGFAEPQNTVQDEERNYEPVRRDGTNQRY